MHTCAANPAQYIRFVVCTVFPRGVQYGTTWHDTNCEWYNTMHTYGKLHCTTRCTVQYDTTRYKPRAIQYNRPTYGKPRTVRSTVRAVFPQGVQYVRCDTNCENAGCKPRYFIYDPRDFLLCPEVFRDTIRGSYCILSGRSRIVLHILTPQTDHAPIRTRCDLILTYGTACRIMLFGLILKFRNNVMSD
jgi:hypothetical protein